MKYIKDFFYSLSDLFIILLILALAAGLVYWRFGIIMDYPEALAAEIKEGGQNLIPDDIANAGNAENSGENSGEASSPGESNSEGTSENPGESEAPGGNSGEAGSENAEEPAVIDEPTTQEPGAGPRDNTIWKDGKLRVDINVNLAGCTAEEAVELLVQAGLFASKEDFEAVCEGIEKNPSEIGAYEYNFSAGFSQKDIADYVTDNPDGDD